MRRGWRWKIPGNSSDKWGPFEAMFCVHIRLQNILDWGVGKEREALDDGRPHGKTDENLRKSNTILTLILLLNHSLNASILAL